MEVEVSAVLTNFNVINAKLPCLACDMAEGRRGIDKRFDSGVAVDEVQNKKFGTAGMSHRGFAAALHPRLPSNHGTT